MSNKIKRMPEQDSDKSGPLLDKTIPTDEGKKLDCQCKYLMNYSDELCDRPEKISENLRKRIRFIVKWTWKKDGGWDDVAEEILMLFYPNLSKREKLVCRCLVQTVRDLGGSCCPCEEMELRLYRYYEKIFHNNEIKNTILDLCNKGIISWVTKLTPERNQDGTIVRFSGCVTYNINPRTLQDVEMEAWREICRLSTEDSYDDHFPVNYSTYLTTSKLSSVFHPILN